MECQESILDSPRLVQGGPRDSSGEGYSSEADFAPWAKQLPCPGWSWPGQQERRGKGHREQICASVQSRRAHTSVPFDVCCVRTDSGVHLCAPREYANVHTGAPAGGAGMNHMWRACNRDGVQGAHGVQWAGSHGSAGMNVRHCVCTRVAGQSSVHVSQRRV